MLLVLFIDDLFVSSSQYSFRELGLSSRSFVETEMEDLKFKVTCLFLSGNKFFFRIKGA